MKAAVLEEINRPLVLKNVETTSLRVGQVLVKVIVSGICGSQLHEINGNKGNSKFLPHLMGHEGCGIVEEVEKINYDIFNKRAKTSTGRRLRVASAAYVKRLTVSS